MTNRLQPIYDIAALCAARHVRQAVLCPGSRNAPLILAFSRHPDITSWSVSDERSAAFIALGMAQQLDRPTALISTSGSAAYNFAPAVAEAFFARSPLIVITADRPTEWVGQQDGQTIFQGGIFGQHVKKSYQLPQEYEHADSRWSINRMVNEAIGLAQSEPKGPVHINIPLREPLYPGNQPTGYSATVRVMEDVAPVAQVDEEVSRRIADGLLQSKRALVVAGQFGSSNTLRQAVIDAASRHHFPVVGDVLSNLHGIPGIIRRADLFLGACPASSKEILQPDLLITLGDSVISKHLKVFLRSYPALRHWHIQPAGEVADTFQSVTTVFRLSPHTFFEHLSRMTGHAQPHKSQTDYRERWRVEEERTAASMAAVVQPEHLGEADVVAAVMRNLPAPCNLHLANSMSVRYATMAGLLSTQALVSVYANRGTSGIDGCTSTAVGHALSSTRLNILITGDVAFFYDRNAFWHNYPLANLRIVVLNNHGGGIFKMIDGPGDTKEVDEFLVTRQSLTAKPISEEFGFEYTHLDARSNLEQAIAKLLEPSDHPKLLEIQTTIDINKNFLLSLKQKLKDNYER